MSKKKRNLDPVEGKANYGPGGFGDMYDNSKMRSMDRDQHPGGVTGIPFEDDIDLETMRANSRGDAFVYPDKRKDIPRDADLGFGAAGTSWNWDLSTDHLNPYYRGRGPKGWMLSDEKLKERVCEVLYHSYEVDPSEMEVTVEDRTVYLKGKIKSEGMRTVAEDLVASIPGVEDVFTQLKIEDTSNFQLSKKALNEARSTGES